MQLTTIRYVVMVAETGSFTKAAELLYVSQPALSQAIARLEQELKVQVFYREHGAVTPTPAGQIIVQEGKKILALEKDILRRVDELRQSGVGSLVLGGAPSYQRYYLSRVISLFQSQYPYVQITLRESYSNLLCDDLLKGTVDIALISDPIPPGIEAVPVFDEEIFLALPPDHPLVEQLPKEGTPYPVADLAICRDESFITYRPGRRITDVLIRETKRSGFTPKILTESASTESANAMIQQGFGVGLVPSVTVELCPACRHARYYRLRPEGLMRQFWLARRAGAYTRQAQRAFFEGARRLGQKK